MDGNKNEIVPTDSRNRKKKDQEDPVKPGQVPAVQTVWKARSLPDTVKLN